MSKVVSLGELLGAVAAVLIAVLLVDSEGLEVLLLVVAFILVASWLASMLRVLSKRLARGVQVSMAALGSGGFSLIRKQPEEQRLAKAYDKEPPKRKPHPLIAALSSGGFSLVRPSQADDGPNQHPEPPAPSVGVG